MASTIQFRFKAHKDFETLHFMGTVIRVIDLKKAIVDKKNMHRGLDFDLELTNAATNEVYTDDIAMVPKNTQVVVKRGVAPKSGGLLSKIKALQAREAAATYAPAG